MIDKTPTHEQSAGHTSARGASYDRSVKLDGYGPQGAVLAVTRDDVVETVDADC